MPFGPTVIGFGVFIGMKFLGYSGYTALVNKKILRVREAPIVWEAGLVRTGIGVSVGVAAGLLYWMTKGRAESLFFFMLIPIRVLEWSFWLWLFYYRHYFLPKSRYGTALVCGIIVSYLLDLVGMATLLVTPGGAWVC